MDADIARAAGRLGDALEAAGIEYAIGGALALGIHGALRATRDVDVNVFCDPPELPAVLEDRVGAAELARVTCSARGGAN